MQPEMRPSHQNIEHLPLEGQGLGFERQANLDNKPETGIDSSPDRLEQISETSAAVADNGLTTTLPMPILNDSSANGSVQSDDNSVLDTPIVASDDDLIEKEWVDKAKKIVSETKDDPYRREEQVNRLQADYLKKRYGRELGVAE